VITVSAEEFIRDSCNTLFRPASSACRYYGFSANCIEPKSWNYAAATATPFFDLLPHLCLPRRVCPAHPSKLRLCPSVGVRNLDTHAMLLWAKPPLMVYVNKKVPPCHGPVPVRLDTS